MENARFNCSNLHGSPSAECFCFSVVLLVAGCGSKEERAQSYYERGMKFLAQHDDVKASIEFRNALQLEKDMVGAWRALVEIEERNRNWDSVAGIRRTIVELDPNDVDAKVRLARLLSVGKSLDDSSQSRRCGR